MVTDPVQSIVGRARESALAALQAGDVEGHLVAMFLRRNPPAWGAEATAAMLAAGPPNLSRTRGVAVAGIRKALGVVAADPAEVVEAAGRELARAPNPNTIRAHDDERLLLGVACAASGAAAAQLAPAALDLSPRAKVVGAWAASFAKPGFDGESVAIAARLLLTSVASGFPDAVALLGLAGELLDSSWRPADRELATLEAAMAGWRNAVVLDGPADIGALDAAWVFLGLGATPASRLARRSTVDAVLATIDAFPSAAQRLEKRPKGRPGVILDDEADVQWLLHALLIPVLDDLVPEDPAAKLAGRGSRLDFTSRQARLGFELKVIYTAGDLGRRREELMIDERQYQLHPYVETVVCFVYDPNGHIALADRVVFENDLSKAITIDGRTVSYVVKVR